MSSSEHRFAVGDRVRVLADCPSGNPRTPRYARGRVGVVEELHGIIVNPQDHHETYPPLCTVVIDVADSKAGDVIALDVHEEWLERAER